MTTITKDEVRNLTPEQQEVIGSAELQRVRRREAILERARRYPGMGVVAGLLTGLACGLPILSVAYPVALLFAPMAVAALVGFHAAGLNRRLDALLDLIDQDKKHTATKTGVPDRPESPPLPRRRTPA